MRRGLALILLAVAIVAVLSMWRGAGGQPITHSPPDTPGIICLGDSLTTGFGLNPDETYPALLPDLLGLADGSVVSRGRDGRTIGEGLRDLDTVLAAPGGTVIVLLGGNDMLRRLSVESSMADLDRIVERLHGRGKMVVLCDFSPFPMISGNWAEGFAEIARRRGCLFVPGVADGLYGLDADTTSADGVHLNAEGQRAMAERIAAALRPHLDSALADEGRR